MNSVQRSVVSDQRSGAAILSEGRGSDKSRRISGCLVRFVRNGGKHLALAAMACLFLVAGCRQDMQDQPKMDPQRGSNIFADHRGARPQVENTVARGQLHEDSYFYTGVIQGANGYREEQNLMPYPVTMEVLRRGQERFNIYCTPCHSRVGNGLGMIVDRGYKTAANLHDQVRMSQPISHYFYVMTHGYGAMPDYAAQLTPEDRWAVAAYIRALQLSQAATMQDVPSGVTVRNLKDLAEEHNLPAADAQPWSLPSTAVQAYPPVTKEGTPAMAPANPADVKIVIPPSKPAPGAAK
ncbi:MAG TPA: cytochrome c [Terracidiphilus sp.]|nr:cytochrome c [Terracidiphilus sp.]